MIKRSSTSALPSPPHHHHLPQDGAPMADKAEKEWRPTTRPDPQKDFVNAPDTDKCKKKSSWCGTGDTAQGEARGPCKRSGSETLAHCYRNGVGTRQASRPGRHAATHHNPRINSKPHSLAGVSENEKKYTRQTRNH